MEGFNAGFWRFFVIGKKEIFSQHMSGNKQVTEASSSLTQHSVMMLFCGCPVRYSHLEKILAPEVFKVTRNSCAGGGPVTLCYAS